MKTFFKNHKKLHIWLLADFWLLAAFWLCRENRDWMNALADHVTTPLRKAVGSVCYLVPFSVMEVLYAGAAVLALLYVVWSTAAVVRRGARFRPPWQALAGTLGCAGAVSLVLWRFAGGARAALPLLAAVLGWLATFVLRDPERRRRAYSALLGAVCGSLSVYLGFCLLWGVNYWTDGFQDKSGITAQPVAAKDLQAVTAYFAQQLTETADQVARDETGAFAVAREDIFRASVHAYDALEERFPFLEFEDRVPKAMAFSRIMSAMGFTGVYCPFTGESNLNVDPPDCLLASTISHELAHQRSIASEQECNFLAVLASTTCDDPAYRYSGWLMGYIHLGNALYKVDKGSYRAIRDTLPAEVLTDIRENDAYWAAYKSAATTAGQTVYDSLLKSYGESDGIQSYGTVVDLLVAYYAEAAS